MKRLSIILASCLSSPVVAGGVSIPPQQAAICEDLAIITFWEGTSHLSARDKAHAKQAIRDASVPNALRPAISAVKIKVAQRLGSNHGNAGDGNTKLDAAREDAILSSLSTFGMCLDGRLSELEATVNPEN